MEKARRIASLIDVTNEWIGRIASILLPCVMFVILFEVVMRYVFDSPTIWVHETSAFFFGAAIMFGGAYTLLHNGHVNMDLFYARLSPRVKAVLDMITSVFLFAFCGVLLWKGAEWALNSWQLLETSQTSFGPPLYPIKTVIPIGASLFILQGFAKFIRNLIVATGGRSHE
ncbi:TRAP transporter small permease subunit [Chloroflexota bacterium]